MLLFPQASFHDASLQIKCFICGHQVEVSDKHVSEIGQGIPAELFRRHKHAVVLLCHVDHLGDLVTVDQKGYVFVWKYSR